MVARPAELNRAEWRPRAAAHEARVDVWVQPHLERRRRGEKHPVLDFLFDYYSHRPAALRRWHPGHGVRLLDAPEYASVKGYEGGTVTATHLASQQSLLASGLALLEATASRPPSFGCFGLHEWAMVFRSDETRHPVPLRLGAAGTDAVVQDHRIACSHFDAYRFFTDAARPLNAVRPAADDRPAFEQPGCLHAGMDLYKHAFRLSPLVPSELVADCFALAVDIRELDMRASPYDLTSYGYDPVRIETPEGKQTYVATQRTFAQRGAPLRQRLIELIRNLRGGASLRM